MEDLMMDDGEVSRHISSLEDLLDIEDLLWVFKTYKIF